MAKESKAAKARELLIAGWSVSAAAKEVGAHYSQVHGIAKKLDETKKDDKKAALKAGIKSTRKTRKPKAAPKAEPTDEPSEWGKRATDVDAGECANCGYNIIEREVFYGGKSYGTALIHVGVKDNAEGIKVTQRCEATRQGGEDADSTPDWEDGDE